MTLEELKAERRALDKKINNLLDTAEKAGRNLSEDEDKEYRSLMVEYEDLNSQISLTQRSHDRGFDPSDRTVVRRYVPTVEHSETRSRERITARDCEGYSITRALQLLAENRALDGLEGELSKELALRSGKAAPAGRGLNVPLAALESRSLTVGTPADGGNTVFEENGGFIEILRNRLATARLGATVFTGLMGDLSFPRQTAKATAGWKAETGTLDEQSQNFDQVEISPNKVGAYTEYSNQLLYQSSIQIEEFVRRDLSRAIAESIDEAAIAGSGVGNEPTGILNTAGIGAVVGGTNGIAPTWQHIVDLETSVADSNADVGRLGYLTNSAIRGKLKQTFIDSGSNAERVWDNRSNSNPLNGYACGISNLVPRDLDKGSSEGVCSAILYGNWEDLLIGFWGDSVQLLVNPYSKDTQGLIRVSAWSYADIALRHAQSFAAMKDALTA
jgi:HK97 family phage major capsid protein